MSVTITAPFNPETGEPHSPAQVPKEVLIDHLRRAIELMDGGGKHWIQGSYTRLLPDGSEGYCSFGALAYATSLSDVREKVMNALVRELLSTLGVEPETVSIIDKVSCGPKSYINPQPILAFNDSGGRTWAEVKSLFESTIERLEKEDADD